MIGTKRRLLFTLLIVLCLFVRVAQSSSEHNTILHRSSHPEPADADTVPVTVSSSSSSSGDNNGNVQLSADDRLALELLPDAFRLLNEMIRKQRRRWRSTCKQYLKRDVRFRADSDLGTWSGCRGAYGSKKSSNKGERVIALDRVVSFSVDRWRYNVTGKRQAVRETVVDGRTVRAVVLEEVRDEIVVDTSVLFHVRVRDSKWEEQLARQGTGSSAAAARGKKNNNDSAADAAEDKRHEQVCDEHGHCTNKEAEQEEEPEEVYDAQLRISCDSQDNCAITQWTAASNVDTPKRSDEEAEQLRAMSVNIWNYNHWGVRKWNLGEELMHVGADVIGFQEVRARKVSPLRGSRFQAQDLAFMLPDYHFVYQPAMCFEEGNWPNGPREIVHEGLAIFSRYPVLDSYHVQLTRIDGDPSDFHQRILLVALVDVPRLGPVYMMVTHLSLSAAAQKLSLRQIGQHAATLDHPAVLVGDFNIELTKDNNPLTRDFGFHDPWEVLHSGEPGFTFSSWQPSKRIDFVFLRNLKARSVSIRGRSPTKQTGLRPIGGVQNMRGVLYPSDHFFVDAVVTNNQ